MFAQIIDAASKAQGLTVVGLLICAIVGMSIAVVVMYKRTIKHHEESEARCTDERKCNQESIIQMQKENVDLRLEQVKALERMNGALSDCSDAIKENTRLIDERMTKALEDCSDALKVNSRLLEKFIDNNMRSKRTPT